MTPNVALLFMQFRIPSASKSSNLTKKDGLFLSLSSMEFLRHFCVKFQENHRNLNFMALKKEIKPQRNRSDALKLRSSRFLRHIIVVSYFSLLVMFFSSQKGPHLLNSDFQVGLTTHRVHPGVSGWVCKL